MNFVVREIERIRWESDALVAASTPHVDWFDWIVERPAKKGKKTVAILYGYTKSEFANYWRKFAQRGWTARVFYNPQKQMEKLWQQKPS